MREEISAKNTTEPVLEIHAEVFTKIDPNANYEVLAPLEPIGKMISEAITPHD